MKSIVGYHGRKFLNYERSIMAKTVTFCTW